MVKPKPKPKNQLDSIDYIVEIIGFLAIILLIVLPLYFYAELPDQIPKHYGLSGTPDSFGTKNIIWAYPVLGITIYMSLLIINKFPHKFNYPIEITNENAIYIYRNAGKMIRVLNMVVVCFFVYLTYMTIQTALGSRIGIGLFCAPTFLVIIIGILGYFVYKFQAITNS